MADFQFLNSMSVVTYVVVIATSILITRYWINTKRKSEKVAKSGGRPLPGPWGIPVFGNMLSLDQSGPHLPLMKLAKVYGNVFKIQMGSRPVLVLNGLEAIKKALTKQPAVFAGRPDLFTFNVINETNVYGPSIGFSTYSEQWKLHRKLAEASLRHFTAGGQVQVLEKVVESEAQELVRYLKASYEEKNTNLKGMLSLSVSNILLWYLLSKRSSYEDKKLIELLGFADKFSKATGSGNPIDFLPWLRFIMTKHTMKLKEFQKQLGQMLQGIIEEHHAVYEPGSERDIVDHIITTSTEIGEEELKRLGLAGNTLLQTVHDFFGAGYETTSATLEWMLLYMASYPQVQSDVQGEIDKVIGRHRLPTLNDFDNLPLTQSCLLEIQRHASVIPFAIPHSTTKDTVLDEYFVPKDMVVFVNLYSAHFDPEVWDQPEVFNARRFLAQDGTLDKDKEKLVVAFGLGRRKCIGSDLARINLFIYFTTLLHQLNFSCPQGQKVSLDSAFALIRRPLEFNVELVPRS
eukprot:XP_793963.1 PREDICTED: cytochrome P450 1A5-like [Strongylocentrotus purpuratus]